MHREKKKQNHKQANKQSEEIIKILKSICFCQPRLEFLREIELWDEKNLSSTSHSAPTITSAYLSSHIHFFFNIAKHNWDTILPTVLCPFSGLRLPQSYNFLMMD